MRNTAERLTRYPQYTAKEADGLVGSYYQWHLWADGSLFEIEQRYFDRWQKETLCTIIDDKKVILLPYWSYYNSIITEYSGKRL